MRQSYPTKETVYQIDAGDYIGFYIFPRYLGEGQIFQDPDALVVGAITGNGNPLINITEGTARGGDYIRANADRISGFKEVVLDVPEEVVSVVEEFNELRDESNKLAIKGERTPEEDVKKLRKLNTELLKYFGS